MSQITLYKKILKFRKLLYINKNIFNINNKYIFICDFNSFNGLALKLLKSQIFSLIKELPFKPYKYLFNKHLFINNNILKNVIYFKFINLFDVLSFIDFLKKKTLLPFLIYPLFIININKNILFSLKNFRLNSFKLLTFKNLIISKLLIILKKIIINLLLKLSLKIKKCQL